MRRMAAALTAMQLVCAAPAWAADVLAVQGAVPASVSIEPGERNLRVALHGRHLDQVTGGAAFRGGRQVGDVAVALGARSPAVRDLFVSAMPTALPGDYTLAVFLDGRRVYLPVLVRVILPKAESGRRLPDAAAGEAARRNQNEAARASVLGR